MENSRQIKMKNDNNLKPKSVIVVLTAITFLIMIIAFASALTYKLGEPIDIRYYCSEINCSLSPTCDITIINPNSSIAIDNQPTTFSTSFYNYTFTPSANGVHETSLLCSDGQTAFKSFNVTPNGEEPTLAKAVFYLGLLFVLMLIFGVIMWAHIADRGEIWKVWWFSIMWIWVIAMTFIAWNMAGDFLTSSGFIFDFFHLIWMVLMIAFPFYLLFCVLFTFYFIYKHKDVQDLMNRGFSLEEAQSRSKGGGRGY